MENNSEIDALVEMISLSSVAPEVICLHLDEMVHDAKGDEAADINNSGEDAGQDSETHDLKSEEASQVNNEGLRAQLEYLFGDCSPEVAKKTVQEIIDECAAERG